MATALNKTTQSYYSGSSGPRSKYRVQNGFKDYDRPILAYTTHYAISLGRGSWGGIANDNTDMGNLPLFVFRDSSYQWQQAIINRCYSRFVESFSGENAGLGTTAAEFAANFGSIAASAVRMRNLWKQIRSGRLRQAIRSLTRQDLIDHRNRRTSKTYSRRRQFSTSKYGTAAAADAWLTYSFGVKPSVESIIQSAEILSEENPSHGKAFGRASTGLNRPKAFVTGSSSWESYYSYGMKYSIEMGADFVVTNPNLFLAQQLGLTNPLLWTWELIPFSFMLDWVFDVSTFIGSFTDEMGVDLSRKYTTTFVRGSGQRWFQQKPSKTYGSWNDFQWASVRRATSISKPLPNFGGSLNIGTSMTRAANAASLLITRLLS